MLKFIAFIIGFILLMRFVRKILLGPGTKDQNRFDPFNGNHRRTREKRDPLDHIEEAEYEDLSDKN